MASSTQQQDFLTVAEDFLDRGQVYRPPEEFIKKLALCPRCIGGKHQTKVLEETLLRMVTLVKNKLNEPGRRNKNSFQAWLKNAAKALELYQVISREWICEKVWKLADLPKRKEQDYDPTKGRRDIRFFPETDSKLLEPTEEESMDTVELDYIDEERLLSLSPPSNQEEKVSSESPRRSPRLIKKTVTQTPQKEKQITRKESQESWRKDDQARKTSDENQESSRISRKGDQAQTCSQARKTSQESQKVQVPRDSEKDTKAKASDATRQESRVQKSVHFVKNRQEACSTKGRERQQQTAQSVKDRRGACSSISGERQVRIVEGYSQNPGNILKRAASGHTEEMIISTTTVKKTKTDDIVHQVRQKVEERREVKDKRRERHKGFKCWVPGCVGDAKYLKAHAYYDHLPSIFDERLESSDERVLRGRRNALKQAGRWLLGRPIELDQLVAFVIVQKLLSPVDNTEITERQERAMQEFCKFLHEPVPDKFVMEPCNSVGALLHWKALLLIAASLAEEEREYWRKTFQAPEDTENQEIQPASPVRVYPEAFDAHFHLDRTLRDMHLPAQGSLDDIIQQAPVDENKKISLVGAVAIYCDPRTYPTDQYLQQMPQQISVGLGFHPKHAKNSVARIEDEVRQFRRLLRNPRVVAFGEVGLDHSEPMKYWAYQVELLEKVLPFLEDRHVLVIHCRGMQGDCGTEAFMLLLYFLRKNVRSHQSVHLHCFTGNSYVLERWLEVFPRTYFGFTNKVRTFNESQIAALCSIEESRLLLESDSPYFPIQGSRVSSPSQLFTAAEAVAAHRHLTVERVLEVTLANGQHLYHEQQ